MKFKFFEHTADTIFEAYGKTFEEAFANAAIALEEVITDTRKVKPAKSVKISARGEDMKSLLYDFLEKFLILFDSEQMLFSDVVIKEITEKDGKFGLTAVAKGEKYDAKKHASRTHVKAITYHEMQIGGKAGKKYVRVLVDI